jgi:hypothetical protein
MDKINFLYAAIADTQATIRAIDVKVGAILVAILLPVQNFSRIFSHLNAIALPPSPMWSQALAVLFIVVWLAALIVLVKALAAIDNPAKHIVNSNSATGVFFAGGLYPLGILDAFFNRSVIRASKKSDAFAGQLPSTLDEVVNELTFEHMKLVYIREIKLKRLYWGLRLSEIWLGLGIAIYLYSKYMK